jgi:hypothetical protein
MLNAQPKNFLKRAFVTVCAVAIVSVDSIAGAAKNTPNINLLSDPLPTHPQLGQTAFERAYLVVGAGKNFPVAESTRYFTSGYPHPAFGYRYTLDDKWILGVSGLFKVLEHKENRTTASLLTIQEESQRLVRIYHPVYLSGGLKILYIVPGHQPRLPLQKDSNFTTEIGAAAVAGLVVPFGDGYLSGCYGERWRGSRSKRLQGVEVGCYLGVAIGTRARGRSEWQIP